MPNVRLNDRIRLTVLERLMEHAFRKQMDDVNQLVTKLARDVYDDVYPLDIQRKMKRLPEGFFETSGVVHVGMAGQHVELRCEGRPVAPKYDFAQASKSYAADHPFTIRHAEIYARKSKLNELRATCRRQAKAVLDNCSSCKQLVEVWPEVEPFVRDFTQGKSPQSVALTVPVKELNRQFGLGK